MFKDYNFFQKFYSYIILQEQDCNPPKKLYTKIFFATRRCHNVHNSFLYST